MASLIYLGLASLISNDHASRSSADGLIVPRIDVASLAVTGGTNSIPLAAIGVALFGISGIVHWIYYFTARPRRKFTLSLTIGMSAMALGFILRIVYALGSHTLGKYIVMDLFILLSPCLFLVTDYVLFSRLVATFHTEVVSRCLLIRPSRITHIFVYSDVLTFLIQSTGGALSAGKNANTAKLGSNIALAGLVLQALSFGLFTVLLIVFSWRLATHFPHIWHSTSNSRGAFRLLSTEPIQDWRILIYILYLTCLGILTRSVFRIVEFAGGYRGYVANHEVFFYLLDALPLWISMTLFCIIWPARCIPEGEPEGGKAKSMILAERGTPGYASSQEVN
ncbi:unnamed protein product [Mycena citricolor]|uniref:RTA1-domain-containing protein n=1 Tax=Mycena citricolor TaxID=2018698 RepID=A0AAD2K3B7_9AGAR|nr:unnamed protein product [Mycena citricolor]CAK5276810.1 unnamed protein product [Mycena citricolor]